ncbi:tautomerase family protein [Amycolatopsis sp. lyj-90]|uniref:tautomerase family protein n=1 Tax=Amycolatopsis sp. lyj-90 TaxID=2789285 RepID=UPI00397BABC3
MPFIDVKIYDRRLTPETRQALIAKLTDAVADVFDDAIRDSTWVVLTPVPVDHWGIGGK